MFFCRDGPIQRVCELLGRLALRPREFLLLLGALGAGKSSLVRAGVVPRLRADHERRWLVLREPRSGQGEATRLTYQLHSLSRPAQATMVLVIDEFKEQAAQRDQPDGPRTERGRRDS